MVQITAQLTSTRKVPVGLTKLNIANITFLLLETIMNIGKLTNLIYKDNILIAFGEESSNQREKRVGFIPVVNVESLLLVGDKVTFAMKNGGEITMELDSKFQPQIVTFIAFRTVWENQFLSKTDNTIEGTNAGN